MPEIHPAADLFPLMDGRDYAEFLADVRARGQQVPIALLAGRVLDGRNRLRACTDLGLEPRFDHLPDDTDALAYVVSANLHRRHLTESQRAMVGAKLKGLYEEAAQERQRATLKRGQEQPPVRANLPEREPEGRARDQAAELVNVSPRSVESASRVIRNGTQELNRLVESGEVSVSAAATVATLPTPEQVEVVSAGPDAIRTRAKEIRESAPPMPDVDPEEERRNAIGQRWCKFLHEIYVLTNSVRDAGDIEVLAEQWSANDRTNAGVELSRIVGKLNQWIDYLERS